MAQIMVVINITLLVTQPWTCPRTSYYVISTWYPLFLWYLVFHTSNETLKGSLLGVFLIGLGIRVLITAYLGTGWQELALEEINTQESRLRKWTSPVWQASFKAPGAWQEQKTGRSFSALTDGSILSWAPGSWANGLSWGTHQQQPLLRSSDSD